MKKSGGNSAMYGAHSGGKMNKGKTSKVSIKSPATGSMTGKK